MADKSTVLYSTRDGVGVLTLNRPESLNALDMETLAELRRVVAHAATDTAARALLVSGEGRGFCAGGDLKQMLSSWIAAGPGRPRTGALEGAGDLHQAVSMLARMPKPVVCAVNGPAAGAGVGLALTGDVVWAAESATFTLAYTAIGLSPDGGTTYFLPRVVGPKRAAELLLTNRKLDAQEALQIGLVSRVLADEELLPAAEQIAKQLAAGPTRAYAEVRTLLRDSLRNGLEDQMEDERQAIARSVMTGDFAEGVTAFVQKRQPTFGGK
jgi:2-(1,2-epoxy-1,2-dihydrophenyl)acetyl-CoA isomerase